jgi:flagellar biosynthesis GTPase FlhF
LAILVVACNISARERERRQQNKIDSLSNEIRKRDNQVQKENQITKEEQADSVARTESKKENNTKKKEQKNTSIADSETKQANDLEKKEQANSSKEQENNSFVEERNSVLRNVIVEKPAFRPLTFGGFKDIRFNFYNNYDYKLEEVILKVHYIRADGSEIKSETKILKDISPNSRMTVTAPDYTQAGRELKVTLESVQCRAINLCFYSMDPVKSADPYKCR